jgi:pilus retraction protein PilT
MERILRGARKLRASDIHLVQGMAPVLRVNGEIRVSEGEPLTAETLQALLDEMSNDRMREVFAREWQLSFSRTWPGLGRFRTSVYLHAGAPEMAIRLCETVVRSAEELGLPPILNELARLPNGLVLITGPTGMGKTTTMNYLINTINCERRCKIITIEDPVEYQIKGITQIPVNEKKGLTFARGLRSILRHDPDKIMVGEIRDQETAQIAINSALTGHLVFTTVHANNVLDVLGRFLNMGVEPYNFVSSLNCILAQRLVRIICPHCKIAVTYPDAFLVESGLNPEEWRDVTFYEGPGCFECGGTGFRGRSAIHELLDLSEKIREMILDKRPASEIRRAARDEGMTFLRDSALAKAREGITTLKEINKVTFIE